MLRLGLKRRKPSVITLADRARDAGRWELAAQFYRKALDRNPRNAPIWVQYGHALKEAADLAQAEIAYRQAIAYDPGIADSHLQLGHALKIQGKNDEAKVSYLRAFALEPSLPHALRELRGLGLSEAQSHVLTGLVGPSTLGSAPERRHANLLSRRVARQSADRSGQAYQENSRPFVEKEITMDDLSELGVMDQVSLLFDIDFILRRYGYKYLNSYSAMHAYFSKDVPKRFDPSPYFSRDLYIHLHPEVRGYNTDPLTHYLSHGRFEQLSPHPLFNTALALHEDNSSANEDIYFRFLAGDCNISFHELVDLEYIRKQRPELNNALDIYRASCDPDRPLAFAPHPLFDPEFYKHFVGSQAFQNELLDFILKEDRCIMTHPLFDPVHYVQTSGLTGGDRIAPLLHYLQNWETWIGEVSPFVDVKFLNHQMGVSPGSARKRPIDPLSYALTHHLNHYTILHPQIDDRIIDRAFRNILSDRAGALYDEPQAQRTARVMGNFLTAPAEPQASEPFVSVVVLNHRKHVYTFFSILAVLNSFDGKDVEIVLVENEGDAYYYECLQRYFSNTNNIRLLKMGTQKYFGEGCNIGTDHANGKYILYLNNDCFLSPDYAQHLRTFLTDHPEAHAVGALLFFPDGTIQEFGGLVSDCGLVVQRAKGMDADYLALHDTPEKVDYVSAACLLLSRHALHCVSGFDLAFEPFFYEDTDLCRRLKAGGLDIFVNPKMTATHIENATTREYLGEPGFYSMIKEHRELFARRWLRNKGEGAYIKATLGREPARSFDNPRDRGSMREVALVYTPFNIRPGGGERFVLSAARALSRDYRVMLCSKEVFSRARVLHVLAALGIPEFEFDICESFEEISACGRKIGISFVMGNEIVPPVPPIATINLFHLQFPFPWRNVGLYNFKLLELYDLIIVNSEFTRKWTARRISEVGVRRSPPIVTLRPPVREIRPGHSADRGESQGLHLVTVGRFFTGGHSKRQDVFLDILERARRLSTAQITATIVGSIQNDDESRHYYMQIRLRAESMQGVEVIVDASSEEVTSALSNADVYVHCAGIDVLEESNPEAMEHFGMSIVEALQAGCIPVVCGVGGPREIIEQSRCGFCFRSVDEAARQILGLLDRSERERVAQRLDAGWIEGLLEPAFTRNLLQVVSSVRSHAKAEQCLQ
jgi:GT2 family glycosyltransferase/tetratricopeptide (TPR) repeat protein